MATIALIVLFSTLLRLGASIRCYDCNSANNSMCLDPTIYDVESVSKYLRSVTCSPQSAEARGQQAKSENMFCRKMVQTILRKGHEPEVRVMRGCGWVKDHRACYKADNEDHLETVCQCFSDDCNAAATARYTVAALITAISITALLQ